MEGRLERMLASACSLLIPVAFLSVFSANQNPMVFVPAILAAVYPPIGVAAAALVTLALLYVIAPFAAYVLAAPLFLVLSRMFSTWRDVAAILLGVPIILLYPPLAPLVLGVVIAQLSSGDEVSAVISGLVFTATLYAAAAIVLPQPSLLGGIIFLPGGYTPRLAAFTDFGKAGELIMYLLLDLHRMPVLLAELITIPLSALAGSMAWRRYGAGYAALAAAAVLSINKFLAPGGLDTGLWGIISLLASLGTINLSASLLVKRSGGKGASAFKGLESSTSVPPTASQGGYAGEPGQVFLEAVPGNPVAPRIGDDVLELLFYDMSAVVEAARRIVERGARIIIYGPRLEDEQLFARYAKLSGSRVLLAHRLGEAWYEKYRGYVVYLPPLDPEEAVDVIEGVCRLRGHVARGDVLAVARERLSGVSRYTIARVCEEVVASGCSDAAPLYSVRPDIGPKFFLEFERVQERLPIIGLKG